MVDDIILVGAMFLFAVFVVGSIIHYIEGEIEYHRYMKDKKNEEQAK